MSEKDFLAQMTDILEMEVEVKMDTVLGELEEWDSLSYVSFISMANATLGKKVTVKDLKSANTVADLYNLVKG
jgi:acyl carrier protein